MKIVLFSVLIYLSITTIMAQAGFICPDQKLQIMRMQGEEFDFLALRSEDNSLTQFKNIELQRGDDYDSFQQRHSTYLALMTEAQLHFPYMPEFLLIFHIGKSNKLFRSGFKALEENNAPVQLKSMYCKSLLEAMKKY
jgi:hypothetical protein